MPAFRFLWLKQGVWRASTDESFRRRVMGLIQKRYAKHSREAELAARGAILDHPYLDSDPWQYAEAVRVNDRLLGCRARLGRLEQGLNAGAIQYRGLEGMTGEPELTAKRLRNRKIGMIDITPDLLLIELPRHPPGDRSTQLWQFWLYSETGSSLDLVDVQDMAEIEPEKVVVRTRGSDWRDPARHLEDDFFERTRDLLGLTALDSIKRMLDAGPHRLAVVTEQAVVKIRDGYGVDFHEVEGARRAAFEADCVKSFGPRSGPFDVAIDPSRLRLQYERQPRLKGSRPIPIATPPGIDGSGMMDSGVGGSVSARSDGPGARPPALPS